MGNSATSLAENTDIRKLYQAEARLRSDDQLWGDIDLIAWLLRDGDELDDEQRELLVIEREVYQWELYRRWDRGLTYPACDFGFARSEIERIRTALPIEAVIGLDVELKPRGKSLRGRCPFHSPSKSGMSLAVRPGHDGKWYCFGCGVGGDVLTWIMAFNHCEFTEALRRLAVMAGEPIPMRRRPQPPSNGPVREVVLR
ncbi:CHC2 zinc finger domain-containing protein [Sphaerobacter thermophilus]|uniref:Zinc finger CHC2-family protein n=1 Tax=Sphaerobacter thermophilus (strain ATCC 49802 / DSM 20745 / KCCM 41009 / NCIMB 13125 / S 6022) TaxID=479434 RepID=D1C6N9_SPHTD|nr:CHC2 zinc finger domain-containing protein [Sphaerobacter thermophilus]ACZ39664.1 zinc finger CHC2-family protein [Sphaerobacter thermophilus DSM 20745]